MNKRANLFGFLISITLLLATIYVAFFAQEALKPLILASSVAVFMYTGMITLNRRGR